MLPTRFGQTALALDLTLYVNGEKVAEAQDEAFTDGRVGLVVGTEATPGLDILFDNFLIASP